VAIKSLLVITDEIEGGEMSANNPIYLTIFLSLDIIYLNYIYVLCIYRGLWWQ
jgi:hypothetical protein